MARRHAPTRIIDVSGRRRLTRSEKIGIGSLATALALTAVGVVAGILIDRLLSFDDALDAGGEWDEGGGVGTRWE
ncbi:hypothetical protein JIP62_09570 [Brevundimonas vitis]|jgi:hypothetical protein|uniref:Uncharacterized protein n=1 Tax=Brevundimonas vitisensis TaxID=2800818 RepID=A0ABX7BJ53_9CAUL|nr:hypothetical protein [Brevundimonas vitisensis]QQQ17591.1 hypothetical protein JIP62_09570 [Brevundimonas vitisensis]